MKPPENIQSPKECKETERGGLCLTHNKFKLLSNEFSKEKREFFHAYWYAADQHHMYYYEYRLSKLI